jgi:hypothetical protein
MQSGFRRPTSTMTVNFKFSLKLQVAQSGIELEKFFYQRRSFGRNGEITPETPICLANDLRVVSRRKAALQRVP